MSDTHDQQAPVDETKPSNAGGATSPLTIKVIAQDGTHRFFKLKPTTPLSKLMHSWCQNSGVRPDSVRFLFDGQRITETQTPAEFEMEDGDVIDVMQEQQGGGGGGGGAVDGGVFDIV